MESLTRANGNTADKQNDFLLIQHTITALAPIFELDEIREISGINIAETDYKRCIDFFKLKTPKDTLEAFRKLCDSSFNGLIDAKKDYCLTKYKHGVFSPNL